MELFFRQKNDHLQSLKENEEAKREAVEAAMSELLDRDTKYRKELKSHMESRLESAHVKRSQMISTMRKVRWKILCLVK